MYISQENHYYPFGMALGGAAANTVPAEAMSKQLYNGGSTLEDELLDPESANYATPYRRYDPAIGRLLGVDPLADKYADLSPGHFAFNDPVNFNDPSGAEGSPADEAVRIAGMMGSSTLVYASGGDGGGGFGEGTRSGTNYVRNDAGELVNPFQWSYTYTTGTGGTNGYLGDGGGYSGRLVGRVGSWFVDNSLEIKETVKNAVAGWAGYKELQAARLLAVAPEPTGLTKVAAVYFALDGGARMAGAAVRTVGVWTDWENNTDLARAPTNLLGVVGYVVNGVSGGNFYMGSRTQVLFEMQGDLINSRRAITNGINTFSDAWQVVAPSYGAYNKAMQIR